MANDGVTLFCNPVCTLAGVVLMFDGANLIRMVNAVSKLIRFPFWATGFLALGVVVLCGLGGWQIQRLHWKNDLIAAMHAAYSTAPVPLDSAALREAATAKPVFTYGTIKGTYLFDAEVFTGPRTLDGVPGYHVITPLLLADKQGWVLVNRGWVPLDHRENYTRAIKRAVYTITGTAREIPAPNRFTPANNPVSQEWYSIDAATIETLHGIDGLMKTVMVYAEGQTPPLDGPVMTSIHAMPNNNHLAYAIFWYAMAVAMVAIYGLRFFVYGKTSD